MFSLFYVFVTDITGVFLSCLLTFILIRIFIRFFLLFPFYLSYIFRVSLYISLTYCYLLLLSSRSYFQSGTYISFGHISSSKDTFVKFWDLDTQHCFRTLLTHKTEVYGLQMNTEETRLYTGSADNEIRVYDLKPVSASDGDKQVGGSLGVAIDD